MTAAWRTRDTCRLCGAGDLETVLRLAPTPPANEFVRAEDPPQELIPLYLARCPSCSHVQLPVVVDPDRLFSHYVYVSGTSPSFVQHFERYAAQCLALRKDGDPWVRRGDFVVEIGSNDGTLLRAFKELGDCNVLGVDPAVDIADRATQSGIPTWPHFFGEEMVPVILHHGGPAALVVANNVFAHADDLEGMARAVKALLDPERGRFVFEVQYLVDLVSKNLFDMVYHEHLSYHSLAPLMGFFTRLGMTLVDAERVDTHGGSIRCVVVPRPDERISMRLIGLLQVELAVLHEEAFTDMDAKILARGIELSIALAFEKGTIAGYGAPAKLTTLAHQFKLDGSKIAYVVDDSPWKNGLLTPGYRIPVVARAEPWPDAFVLFAWNFAEPIAAKLRAAGYTGRIVVPLPAVHEL